MLTKKATDALAIVIPGWINRLKGIVLIPIILHALGLATYGAYVEIMTNVLILTGFAQLALGQAVLRYGSSVETHEIKLLREIFWSPVLFSAVLASILCTALVVAAAPLSRMFLRGEYAIAIALAAPLVVSESVGGLLQIYLNSRRRLKQAALFRFLKDILPYLSFTAMIYAYRTLTPGIVAMTATSWVVVGIMGAVLAWEVGRPCFRWPLIKQYLRFSWPFAAMAVTEGNLAAVPRFIVP
ncbi:MAG: oligosaccharide flippase family protein, partial [Acidiferrobacteraceae bacterium]